MCVRAGRWRAAAAGGTTPAPPKTLRHFLRVSGPIAARSAGRERRTARSIGRQILSPLPLLRRSFPRPSAAVRAPHGRTLSVSAPAVDGVERARAGSSASAIRTKNTCYGRSQERAFAALRGAASAPAPAPANMCARTRLAIRSLCVSVESKLISVSAGDEREAVQPRF